MTPLRVPQSYSCPSVAPTSREEAGALFLGSRYKAACVPQTQTLSLCLHQVVQAERNCTLCTPTSCSCTLQVCKALERKPGSRLLIQTCRLCCAEGQEQHFFRNGNTECFRKTLPSLHASPHSALEAATVARWHLLGSSSSNAQNSPRGG